MPKARRRSVTVARLNPDRLPVSGPRTPHTGILVETRIESLAAGGDGVGRMPDGRALFVPLSAPGDRVTVRVVEQRKRYARGEIEDLLEEGPGRREPVCPVFGDCGGCRWQHLEYPVQLEAKRSILAQALRHIGGLSDLGEIPMTASPQPYRYRARARIMVQEQRVGFRRRASNEHCPVGGCPVLVEALDERLAQLARQAPLSGEWELAAGEDGRTYAAPADASKGATRAHSVRFRVEGHSLRNSLGVFSQANAFLRGALVRAVRSAAIRGEDVRRASLLELYSGAGMFTIPLAACFARVCAVESSAPTVRDLTANLAAAGIAHVEVRSERVERLLAGLAVDPWIRPDVVVLDPPRTGLARGSAAHLAGLGALRIVYLSCDPATLARDLSALSGLGYGLDHVEGFDLFPQTAHVESLALLSPRGRASDRRDARRRHPDDTRGAPG